MIEAETSKPPMPYDPQTLPDFRRIIFTGNAPSLFRVHEDTKRHYRRNPRFAGRFVEGVIELLWVAANGAAWLARCLKMNAERWEGDPPYVLLDHSSQPRDEL